MALLKVLLLLLLGVSVNSGVSLQKRIIGGQNCDNTERRYHVRLESSNGTHMKWCGGSLINPQWILTAARCWKSEPGWTIIATLKVHPRNAGVQSQVIQQRPAMYDYQHDIMLLKLPTPVRGVPFARLPDCRYRLRILDTVQLAGEGATSTGPNNRQITNAAIPTHLQCVNMKVRQISQLHEAYGNLFYAEAVNRDISFGDSGGAVLYNRMIYGVISFVGNNFAFRKPAMIVDVCEYMWWIKPSTRLN